MGITDFSLEWFSLAGRTAVVTGGNSGLGQAFSLALATAGADVCVPTLLDDGGETRALVEARGRRYTELTTDLTRDGAADEVVAACAGDLGGPDVLVNCAGLNRIAPWEEFGRAQWDPMIDVNLTAPFAMTRAAAPGMVARGRGKIINVASVFSFLGGRGSPAYAATKHGLVGLTRTYADELGGHGVQVNAIAPGYVVTALTAATRADPVAERAVRERTPAGRWGETEDLMGTVVFLASRASDHVNGHVLTVDGGYLVR
ncbi:SDR family oxidoreductase [Nocardioides sp. AX2bis]|uniref:SDR family oxidoreductase n=1 Tax=Nocardioides sp. AX2bis TaxID=2653157 RepID=UPI0012F0C4FB|nr:SDR family oxidoreductase [Nocardioides sp. AX2bis]VXC57323.1 putative deoxygluconate dehydrogenase [Nocardioides sp. AX2bis]